jgi:hypothetical protein
LVIEEVLRDYYYVKKGIKMSAAFDDVMHVMELEDDTIEKMKKAGIRRFNHFLSSDADQLVATLESEGVRAPDIRELVMFQRWYREWRLSRPTQSVEKDFVEQVWWDFVFMVTEENMSSAASLASSQAPGSPSSIVAAVPSTTVPVSTLPPGVNTTSVPMTVPQVVFSTPVTMTAPSPAAVTVASIPTLASPSKTAALQTLARNLTNFKWDKNVPLMSKTKPVQDIYNDWEDLFMVQMTLGHVSAILKDSYIEPTDPEEIEVHETMQMIVKAVILQATYGTTAAAYLDIDDNGRAMFLTLRRNFKGATNTRRRAADAAFEMQTLVFNKNSKYTADAFASRFILNLKRMRENGSGVAENLIKSTFLMKILHPSFSMFRAVVQDDDNVDFPLTLQRFRERAQDLRNANGGVDPGGDTNKKTVNAATGESEKKISKKGKGKSKSSTFIPPEQWAKLSEAEQAVHRTKAKERREAAKAKAESEKSPADAAPLPQQYNGHSQSNTVVAVPTQTYSQVASQAVLESNLNRAAALLNQCVLPSRSNNVQVSLSPTFAATLLNGESSLLSGSTASLCVDGGTNISLMGSIFRVIAWTNRYADMMGFASDVEKKRVRIASGVAVYTDSDGLRVLIGLHESPYLENNTTSLLSTGQAREHGVWVDDLSNRHGGRQMIMANDIDGNAYTFPMESRSGLLEIQLSHPSDEDINSLPIIWLTSDEPWDPTVLDNDESIKIIPPFDDFIEVSSNMADLVEANCFMKHVAQQNDLVQAFAYATGILFIGNTLYRVMNSFFSGDTKVKIVTPDYNKYRPLLGWLPLDTVRRTFEATTQLAKELPMRFPLRRHIKSRNPALNRRRLQESFATDTLFSSHPAIGGYTCAQLFCGLKSQYYSLHGMKSESEGPEALEDFVRDVGSPFSLRNDNSKMQTGIKWREVLRKYTIAEEHTEPHHPQQNPAERRIGEVKKYAEKIMDRTGAPAYLWLFCMLYITYLLNRTAVEQLGWRTPYEKCFGETPDISGLLQFAFYEPVYYLDPNVSYPDTKEKLGHFLGIAENTGDDMVFWVLTGKRTVLARSVCRSALNISEPNKRQDKPDARRVGSLDDNDEKPIASSDDPSVEKFSLDLLSDLSGNAKMELPVFDPMDIMGYQFLRENDQGVPVRATVKEYSEDIGKFRVTHGDDEDDWVNYSDIQESMLSRNDDGAQEWVIKEIVGHRQEGPNIDVQVKWDNGSITWEHMEMIKKDDPVLLAIYAKERNLSHSHGWRWARKMLKSNKRFARALKLLKGQVAHGPKYKFGVLIPRNKKHALQIDKENGNTLWADSMDAEIQVLLEFETFRILPKGQMDWPDKEKYTYVPLHLYLMLSSIFVENADVSLVETGRILPKPRFSQELYRLRMSELDYSLQF